MLRTYSPTEAAMDIFTDDSKTRYKGSITLDKETNPVMIVKTSEIAQRRKVNAGYMVLKVGKNTYHFSTDTFSEMAEWCALIRQAISDGKFACKVHMVLSVLSLLFWFRSIRYPVLS